MLIKRSDKVQYNRVDMEGVVGTRIQWLMSKEDGALNFAMRRFTIAPDGRIPLHDHPWEHEIYILSGTARVFTESMNVDVTSGDVLYVPPDEPHGYHNTGAEDLVFLCLIPNSGDKR